MQAEAHVTQTSTGNEQLLAYHPLGTINLARGMATDILRMIVNNGGWIDKAELDTQLKPKNVGDMRHAMADIRRSLPGNVNLVTIRGGLDHPAHLADSWLARLSALNVEPDLETVVAITKYSRQAVGNLALLSQPYSKLFPKGAESEPTALNIEINSYPVLADNILENLGGNVRAFKQYRSATRLVTASQVTGQNDETFNMGRTAVPNAMLLMHLGVTIPISDPNRTQEIFNLYTAHSYSNERKSSPKVLFNETVELLHGGLERYRWLELAQYFPRVSRQDLV